MVVSLGVSPAACLLCMRVVCAAGPGHGMMWAMTSCACLHALHAQAPSQGCVAHCAASMHFQDILLGQAKFAGPHKVKYGFPGRVDVGGEVTAKDIIIATGSVPFVPPGAASYACMHACSRPAHRADAQPYTQKRAPHRWL